MTASTIRHPPRPTIDFAKSPLLVFYELTRACDLACLHCRACAQRDPAPDELSTAQSRELLEQLTDFPTSPLVVFTGGDPFKRRDLPDLVRHATSRGLEVAVTPSATPLVTPQALQKLREAGTARIAVSLDGPDASSHDSFRGVAGSFQRTLEIIADARRLGLQVQINTTVTPGKLAANRRICHVVRGAGHRLMVSLLPGSRRSSCNAGPTECRRGGAGPSPSFGRKASFAHFPSRPRRHHTIADSWPRKGPTRVRVCPPRCPAAGTVHWPRMMARVSSLSHTTAKSIPAALCRFPAGFSRGTTSSKHISDPASSWLFAIPSACKANAGLVSSTLYAAAAERRSYAVTGEPLAAEPDCAYVPQRLLKGNRQ